MRPGQRQSTTCCKTPSGGGQANIAASISACDVDASARHTGPGWQSRFGDQCLSKQKPVEKLGMNDAIRILTVTSEWIDTGHGAPFIARQVEFLRRAGIDVEVFAF